MSRPRAGLTKVKVWPIIKPGYGDFDGYPEELWSTRAGAARRCDELNAPWRGTRLDRPGKRPFRVGRALEVRRMMPEGGA